MARTLLVTHTKARPGVAERARSRMSPVEHIELAGQRGFAKGVEDVLPPEARQSIQDEAMRWLKRLPGLHADGRALGEVLIGHGAASLWWWIESPLWFGDPAAPLSPPLPELLTEVEAVRALAKSASIDRIEFAADHPSLVGAALRELAEGLGIPFGGRVAGAGAKGRLVGMLRPAVLRRVLLRRRASLPPAEPAAIRVLLVSHTNALRKVGDETRDVYLGPLAEELARRGVEARTCYVNAAADANPREAPPPMRLPEGGFLVEQAIDDAPAGDLPDHLSDVLRAWNGARSGFPKDWAWRGISLARTFDRWMDRLIERHAPSALYYTAAFEEVLAAWRPETVVVTNETGYAGRAVVAVARRRGIRSVGVQHGLIGPHHVEYMHDPRVVDPANPWRCPIPDLTAVDGLYAQKALTEVSAFPRDAVVVTGQMRYEVYLSRRSETPRRSDLILVATQPLPGTDVWTADVLEATAGTGDVVLKVHPLEDVEAYRRLVSARGTHAQVVKDLDLFELLSAAAVLVARSSTTIVEAALANCPVVVYNPTGLPDPVAFAELGGGVAAGSRDALAASVRDVLAGGASAASLRASRTQFLQQFAFGGGSGCASRLADALLLGSGG